MGFLEFENGIKRFVPHNFFWNPTDLELFHINDVFWDPTELVLFHNNHDRIFRILNSTTWIVSLWPERKEPSRSPVKMSCTLWGTYYQLQVALKGTDWVQTFINTTITYFQPCSSIMHDICICNMHDRRQNIVSAMSISIISVDQQYRHNQQY